MWIIKNLLNYKSKTGTNVNVMVKNGNIINLICIDIIFIISTFKYLYLLALYVVVYLYV